MSYKITLSNGNVLASIPDTQVVSTYAGLDFVGKFMQNFGTVFNNNLAHMVENFADSVPPANPLTGQIWFDTVSNSIKFWNGNQFKPISVITSNSSSPINPQVGDEWYNTNTEQLNIWNGYEWIVIGPQNNSNSGKEGWIVGGPINGVYYLELYTNNVLIAIVSTQAISNPGISGFTNIRPGFNFVLNPESQLTSAGGMYNIDELTIGPNDESHLTIDAYGNALWEVNGSNAAVITNGNATANTVAAAIPVSGTLYVNEVVSNNYVGLPVAPVPGITGQLLYNYGNSINATNAITVSGSQVTAPNLLVTSNLTSTGATTVGSLTANNIAIDSALVINGTSITTGNAITSSSFTANVAVYSPLVQTSNLNVSGTATVGTITASIISVPVGNVYTQSAYISDALNVQGSTNVSSLTVDGLAPNGNVLVGNGTKFVTTTLGPTRSSVVTNSYGTYIVWSDGLKEAWGTSPALAQAGNHATAVINFPNAGVSGAAFTTPPVITGSLDNVPQYDSTADTIASINFYGTTATATTAYSALGVVIGGSGASGYVNTVHVMWYARGF